MKKRHNWIKILSGILCILSFNIAVISVMGFVGMESVGLYEREKEDVQKEVFDSALRDYSILAMTRYQDDFGMKELEKTNFRYGIIQIDSIEGLDLNDKSIYEVCNFDRKVTEDMLHIYSCNMGENTSYYAGKTLFDQFYIYNDDGVYQEVYHPIEACYYVRNTKQLYYLAEGKLYLQRDFPYIDSETGEETDLSQEILQISAEMTDSAADVQAEGAETAVSDAAETAETKEATKAEDGEFTYIWKEPNKQILVQEMRYFLSDITIVTSGELENKGKIVSAVENSEEYSVGNGEIVTYDMEYVTSKPYFVLSYVNEPLISAGEGNYLVQSVFAQLRDWDSQDFFVQLKAILNLAYAMRFGIYIAMFVSTIVFLVSFILFMRTAGYESGSEGIRESWWERIPYDVLFWLVLIIVCSLLAIVAASFMGLSMRLAFFFGFFGVLGSEWLCLRFLESTAIRSRQGNLWKNTLFVICLRWCRRIIKSFLHWCREICGKFSGAVPFLWKAWIIMGVLACMEFVGLVSTGYQPEVQLLLWFMEKVVLYGVLSLCLLQLYHLQQGAKKIADGETNSRVNTEKMFWDFKEHGENLNRIQDGIGKAVAERMKSERFKTELITNVSHDIKTPLTSIINYVDLLEKEDVENPKVQEYLEVLSRQSIRLKKLIEDLIEASKASTGNLAVMAECCDAGVMLTQTIGEFEEKLKAGQIELLVQNSKEPVYIHADPRHLWRIFDNLMNNICKYAQPGTRAYVNIEKADGNGRIIFRNISKYALNINSDDLMERFVRGDSSRNTEGSGLGLSIAKSLTELMQGTFELVVDGDLFKVIVTFPLTEKEHAML